MKKYQIYGKTIQLGLGALLLSTIGLVVCNVNAQESAQDSALAASVVGVYTGDFKPTVEQIRIKKNYATWLKQKLGTSEGDCCDYITRLTDIPKPLRSYVYKDPLYGTYELSKPARLSLIVERMLADNSFQGRSIASGHERPVSGTWLTTDKGIRLNLSEPTDMSADGTFLAYLNPTTDTIVGSWTPYSDSAGTKSFLLKKMDFAYKADMAQDYVGFNDSEFDKNPSTVLLTSKDIENLGKPHLRWLKNFIYARHGYAFSALDVRQQFEQYEWYVPVKTNVDSELTEIEAKNIELLTRYEAYANDHYESFGR